MKVSDLKFETYQPYQRIAVLRRTGPEYCAAGAEDYVMRTYQNEELAEDGVVCENGWLTLKLQESVRR